MTLNESLLIRLINPNEIIKNEDLKEVTSSKIFLNNSSELNPEGLASDIIFGKPGSPERKTSWGYISLGDVFMAPHVFYVLKRLKSGIANDMKVGLGRYYVDHEGELQKLKENEVPPETALYKKPGTGFDWLKEAWPYISWKITNDMTNTAKIKRRLLKSLSVDQVFWDKVLVLPAFYRDVDIAQQKKNVINSFYTSLMYYSEILKKNDMLNFYESDPTIPSKPISFVKIQDKLIEIYDFFFSKLGGANGFVNKYVVGKATDYGARLVITTPSFNCERFSDAEVDFFHSSVPLSVAINIFAPFMIYNISRWLSNYIGGQNSIRYYDFESKSFTKCDLDPTYIEEMTESFIRAGMSRYRDDKHERLKPVTLKGVGGKRIPVQMYFSFLDGKMNFSTDIGSLSEETDEDLANKIRNITFCEFYYLVAEDCLAGKAIYNTRYPADDYYHTYPSQMNIIPSTNYTQVYVDGRFYKRYPITNVDRNDSAAIERLFIDTMRMHSVFPASLGADFDGDQISTAGVFSEEGNADTEKHMRELTNVIGINGEIIREFPNVVKHGIYNLTYRIPKPESK